jgi:molybdopterin/thiamine biosynthesis adenylyltransferase
MSQSQSEPLLAELTALKTATTAQPPSVSLSETLDLSRRFALSRRDVEIAALQAGVLPERYRRNHGTVGWEGQIRLLGATVGIVGAGGLGGWIIEGLARMGVGRLVIIDGDVFEENNLNRQIGCTEATLGRPKAEVMGERAITVNGATEVTTHRVWLAPENAAGLLAGSQIIVDALDSLPARIGLEQTAREMDVPMVHGAIAGYSGQVTIVYPGDPGLRSVYGPGPYPEHGIETTLGNPSATPIMIAAWQIQQVVKFLVQAERGLLRNRLLLLDAQAGDALILDLAG